MAHFPLVRRLCLILTPAIACSTLLVAQQPAPATPAAPQTAAPAGRGGRGAPPVKSPEVAADGRVTFRLRAPNAKEVALSMGGKQLPMQKDEQGVWSFTSEPMNPDIYTYSLVVDGTSINDPANRQVQTSFGSFQSMLVIPGSQPWLPSPGVARGVAYENCVRNPVSEPVSVIATPRSTAQTSRLTRSTNAAGSP